MESQIFTLVVVESPSKAEKLKLILGAGYKILCSYGHIRDLPKKTLGYSEHDYTPEYVVTNHHVLRGLKEAAVRAKNVVLATNSSREGEFIAWHLKEVLGLVNPKRVDISEITKTSVLQALDNPRSINLNLVRAHEARRILDRMIGYKLKALEQNLASIYPAEIRMRSQSYGIENEDASLWKQDKLELLREIEAELDLIAHGKADFQAVVANYDYLLKA